MLGSGRPSDSRETAIAGGIAPVNYIQLQYDYNAPLSAPPNQEFNIYTHFIHVDLNKSAYSFWIDDRESVQNSDGTGLIFQVGGVKSTALPNPNPVPPPVPAFYNWYTARVILASSPKWKSYGICNDAADTLFPINGVRDTFGLDPRTIPASPEHPCKITLKDTSGTTYQLAIVQMMHTGPLPYQFGQPSQNQTSTTQLW